MANALLLGQASRLGDAQGVGVLADARAQGQNMAAQRQQMGQNNALFQQQQQDRQRQMAEQEKERQMQPLREDYARFMQLPDDNARTQAWQGGLAQHYGQDPNSDWKPVLAQVTQQPGFLPPELTAKMMEQHFAPKEQTRTGLEWFQNPDGTVDQAKFRMELQRKTAATEAGNAGKARAITPYEKETQRQLGKLMPQLQQQGIAAQSDLVKSEQVKTGLSNAFTGTGASAKTAGAKALNFVSGGAVFGKELQDTERTQAYLNEFALEARNPSGGAGMPGAMSDQDRKFLQEISGRIDNQTARLDEVVAARQALNRRKIEVADAANRYVKEHGTLDSGFYEALAAVGAKPMFDGAAPQPGGGGAVQITSDAEYDALPSGADFIDPEGNPRVKP